jgi:uncharacterized protein (UPF0333 family)
MKKGIVIGVIVGIVLIILIIGFFVLTNNKGNSSNQTPNQNTNSQDANADVNKMVDCGEMNNPSCFQARMTECLPVTAKLTGTDGSPIEITILGIENNTCHFQRKVSGAVNLNCYFPKGTMNWDTIDQTFGNDKGLQSVVDSACKSGW